MPGVEIAAARKKNGAQDHSLFVLEGQAATGAGILPLGENTTAVGAKLNEAVGGCLFPGGGRKQCGGDCSEFFGVGTAKIGVRGLCAILEFESDVSNEQAFCLNFLEVAPVNRPDTFSPASVALDREEQDAFVGHDEYAGRQKRRPPSGSELLHDGERTAGRHCVKYGFARQQDALQYRAEFLQRFAGALLNGFFLLPCVARIEHIASDRNAVQRIRASKLVLVDAKIRGGHRDLRVEAIQTVTWLAFKEKTGAQTLALKVRSSVL